MGRTSIEWTDHSWPVVNGCRRVSAGCENCYAERLTATRLKNRPKYAGLALWKEPPPKVLRNDRADGRVTLTEQQGRGRPRWTGETRLWAADLDMPLRIKKPSKIFVCDMGDLFYEGVPDEDIDQVLAVMMLAPRHTYQVLTKRPERMRQYLSDEATPFRVAKAADRLMVRIEIDAMGPEQIRPIVGYPGYYVSDRGRVLSGNGSATCLHCGGATGGTARALYCSKVCKQNASYHRNMGRQPRHERALKAMALDEGEQGHQRVMLYQNAEARRELVHRLVLTAFVGEPLPGQQGCHRDGDPSNNALPNLRWGTQGDNWQDRKRHGNGRSYAKLLPGDVEEIRLMVERGHTLQDTAEAHGISATQVKNIIAGRQWVQDSVEWPLPCLWVGVSVEDQHWANERIPHLLATPAAVRFVSAEPLLGPVRLDPADLGCVGHLAQTFGNPLVNWVIVGGESGPGARPFDLTWARQLVQDCAASATACFVKQLGAVPVSANLGDYIGYPTKLWQQGMAQRLAIRLQDRKGGEPDEWPADLRVREFPRINH